MFTFVTHFSTWIQVPSAPMHRQVADYGDGDDDDDDDDDDGDDGDDEYDDDEDFGELENVLGPDGDHGYDEVFIGFKDPFSHISVTVRNSITLTCHHY